MTTGNLFQYGYSAIFLLKFPCDHTTLFVSEPRELVLNISLKKTPGDVSKS